MDDLLIVVSGIAAFVFFVAVICKGDALKWYLGDKSRFCISKINKWHPRKCKTEKDYEKSLYGYLHKTLPKSVQVTSQHGKGRIHADIVVGDTVLIELKHNLNTTSKLQRLMGQLIGYKEWKKEILVLLIGKTEPNIRKELNRFIKKEMRMETLKVYQKGRNI